MALSKAVHGNRFFTVIGSGTANLATSNVFVTAVNTSLTAAQWKMKELLFQRSLNGAIDVHMYAINRVSGVKFLLKSVLATTSTYVRIAANLVDGEYLLDAESEIQLETASVGGGETWKVKVTGQVNG